MKRRTVPRNTIVAGAHSRFAQICHATYILKDRKPQRCLDYDLWERWIDYPDDRCVVGMTQFFHHGIVVETRFLGVDVSPCESQGPLLFETAVDGGDMTGHRNLYKTWEEAALGHEIICDMVRDTMI